MKDVSKKTRSQSTGGQKLGASVVVPVWGSYEKYLDECLLSLTRQTYRDFEIIVVRDYTDLPSARNAGISEAKGEYILILDVDNKLEPTFLEKTVGKGDIVVTHHQFFGDSNGTFRPGEPSLELFKSGNQIDANALIKKSVFDDLGGYDETMKDGWEDYEFWVRCCKAGYKFTIIPELLLLYRKTKESMSITAGRKSVDLQNYILNKHNLK
jgi:glycosyltransferase involved in cell wall biosynthesis